MALVKGQGGMEASSSHAMMRRTKNSSQSARSVNHLCTVFHVKSEYGGRL
jgi:hypothetical protein